MSKILEKIFSIKNVENYNIITIFGVQFKHRNKLYSLIQENLNNIKSIYNWCTNYRLYSNEMEKHFIQPFIEYIGKRDFREKYLNCIKYLENEEIAKLNTIIKRIQIIQENPTQQVYDFYSHEEKQKLYDFWHNFVNKIIKIDENLYVYNQYKLPENLFGASLWYYNMNLGEIKNINKIKNKYIIDAGASVGDSAVLLSKYTNQKVMAFEPIPSNYNLIPKTCELNNIKNVVPINKALYNINTTLDFYIDKADNMVAAPGSSIEKPISGNCAHKIQVEAITLDSYVKENNLEVGLIKTDLEGVEQKFLEGAVETIKQQKPVLLISIYHKPEDLFEIIPFIANLNLGYKFKIIRDIDVSFLIETSVLAEVME